MSEHAGGFEGTPGGQGGGGGGAMPLNSAALDAEHDGSVTAGGQMSFLA